MPELLLSVDALCPPQCLQKLLNYTIKFIEEMSERYQELGQYPLHVQCCQSQSV